MIKLLTPALALAAVTACAGPTTSPSRRYIGTATPSKIAPLCSPSKAEAQVRQDTIILAPDEGTWILQGLLSPDGRVSADKTEQAANKQPWSTSFVGHWTPTTINGTYTTPRCTFSIELKLP
jgi:hypothetical protein